MRSTVYVGEYVVPLIRNRVTLPAAMKITRWITRETVNDRLNSRSRKWCSCPDGRV